MGILSLLARGSWGATKAGGRGLFGLGRTALTLPYGARNIMKGAVARATIGAGVGAIAGVKWGPEGLSWQDRAFAGAVIGAGAGGIGASILMRGGTWKRMGKGAWGTARRYAGKNISAFTKSPAIRPQLQEVMGEYARASVVAERATAAGRFTRGRRRAVNRAVTGATIEAVRSTSLPQFITGLQAMPILRTPQKFIGAALVDLPGPLLMGGAIVGGGVLASNIMQEQRVSRFQESTGGLVQGMHQGRHRS